MTYIPNGIDHDEFRLERPIEGRAKRVLMMYDDAPWKGSADGIAALEEARKRCEFNATVFGRDKKPKGFPSWIDYLYFPAQDELVRLYNSSSIFLNRAGLRELRLRPRKRLHAAVLLFPPTARE